MSELAIHPAALDSETLLRQCQTSRSRASGPGGQHRNKVETAITLTHEPTGITAQAGERRSQRDNLRIAIFRLRINLALETRVPVDRDAPPSSCWSARVSGNRLALNPTHEDFPTCLAEVMDRIAAEAGEVSAAAAGLGVSMSQLLKLLRHEPRGLAKVNAIRIAHDLRPLR